MIFYCGLPESVKVSELRVSSSQSTVQVSNVTLSKNVIPSAKLNTKSIQIRSCQAEQTMFSRIIPIDRGTSLSIFWTHLGV